MRYLVWVAWAAVAAALAPQISRLQRADIANAPAGSESALVANRLREEFAAPISAPLLLVIRGLPAGLSDDSARAVLRRVHAPLESSGGVRALVSPASRLDTLLWSADRRSALAVVETTGDARVALRVLRERSAQIVADARSGGDGGALRDLTMRWTGEAALFADLKDLAATELRRSEWRALPITLLVAWWAFGTLMEATIAIAIAVLVVTSALGIVGVLSAWWPASPLTASVVSLTGLALTIDYQLIVRRATASGSVASEATRLVYWAALLVSAAFALLALLPTGDVRGAAMAGTITTALAALAAAARSTTTHDQEDGAVRRAKPLAVSRQFADRGRWRAWGRGVTRHAWLALLTSTAVMAWLAWPVSRLRLSSPVDTLLPSAVESMQAIDDLKAFGRGAVPLALTVLVDLPRDLSAFDAEGWSTIQRGVEVVRAQSGVARVDAITTIGTGERVVTQHVVPVAVQSALVSRSRRTVRLTVWPRSASVDSARTLADRLPVVLRRAMIGDRIMVSGLPVVVRDVTEGVRRTLPLVVVATTVMSILILTWRFRAPLLAVKAVVVNAAVAAAAMGLLVRVFQDGVGASIFGVATFSGIFPTVPLLVFTATFGVSMDYELVLLTAVERATKTGAHNAVATAMADVGALIWRAAALTGAVCGAFALSTLAPLAMIGVALVSVVLLDATLVRLVMVPAWLTIAGRWNWWPREGRASGSDAE